MSAAPPAAPAQHLHPLDVRHAVRQVHPEAVERLDGTTFDLPDGSLLSRRDDGGWTLLAADGSTALRVQTLPQLRQALHRRVLVIPAVVLSLLEDIEVRQTRTHSRLLGDLEVRLRTADRLGLVQPQGPSSWRLTPLGIEASQKMRRGNYIAVMIADETEAEAAPEAQR